MSFLAAIVARQGGEILRTFRGPFTGDYTLQGEDVKRDAIDFPNHGPLVFGSEVFEAVRRKD